MLCKFFISGTNYIKLHLKLFETQNAQASEFSDSQFISFIRDVEIEQIIFFIFKN